MKLISFLLVAACVLFVSSLDGTLHAYLDPGTGSVAIQLILGGVVAGLAAARVYWSRLKTLFGRRQVKSDSSVLD